MNNDIYSQIVALKNERNDVARGRYFEALIREIMPWDHRPPIVMSPANEQLDGVFNYKGITYLIESKAIKATITPGMKEWEDFELKLRKRERQDIIGLFCCLFDVSEATIKTAEQLNKVGIKTIIIFGGLWDKLSESNLYFPSFLDFMTLNCKIKFTPAVTSLKEASKWIYDTNSIDERFTNASKKFSAPFLRRFKHKYHDKIFVERSIGKQIRQFTELLRPIHLKAQAKKDTAKQVIVVRDYSGCGKTTLSANFASFNEFAYCIVYSANLTTVDEVLDPFLDQLNYPNMGLSELLAVDKPILFIIDSLDETPLHLQVQKRRELKSLLKRVEELNAAAVPFKMAMYPIMLLFTVREDYWRDWEAVFEGRADVLELKKMISSFNTDEFKLALERYELAYDYSINNNLNQQATDILSVPINLEIFSEANHFDGAINVDDIWEGKILSNFFSKKEDLINKHYIDRFNDVMFYRLLGLLAFELLRAKTTLVSKVQFRQIVGLLSADLELAADKILLQLVSEQIITNDTEENKNFRFKYIRFIEYLAAFFIVQEVERTAEYSQIDNFIRVIYDSNIVSIFSVFNNLKHICHTRYPEMEEEMVNHYAQSATYLSRYLPELRGRIGRGESISDEDIKSILTNTFTPSAFNSWHTFFIISAKYCQVTKDVIFSAFNMAWENNREGGKRWQLIQNLAKRDLLISESVLLILLKDGQPREWAEYLGQILKKKKDNDLFIDLWIQIGGDRVLSSHTPNIHEWQLTNRLLDLIMRNEEYIISDMMTEVPREPYMLFEPEKVKKIIAVPEREKQFLDDFIAELKDCLEGVTPKMVLFASRFNEMSKEGALYLNQETEDIFSASYGPGEQSFISYLLCNFSEHYSFIRGILEAKALHYELQSKDKNGRTTFIELIESAQNKATYLELLFLRGYKKNPDDEHYLQQQMSNHDSLSNSELENTILGYCYYKVTHPADLPHISKLFRQLYILFCFRFNRIISFKFNNMIQVVNTALEHYGEFETLFLRALEVYGLYEQMDQKPSFRKKLANLRARRVAANHEYDRLFESIFPLLFQ